MLLRDWAWIKRVSMWNASPVPKTGQILKESSIYQMVIKKRMGLVCIDKMTIVALKVPSYKANERGVWHPESKNRSTVKARFRHPRQGMPGVPFPVGLCTLLVNHHVVSQPSTA